MEESRNDAVMTIGRGIGLLVNLGVVIVGLLSVTNHVVTAFHRPQELHRAATVTGEPDNSGVVAPQPAVTPSTIPPPAAPSVTVDKRSPGVSRELCPPLSALFRRKMEVWEVLATILCSICAFCTFERVSVSQVGLEYLSPEICASIVKICLCLFLSLVIFGALTLICESSFIRQPVQFQRCSRRRCRWYQAWCWAKRLLCYLVEVFRWLLQILCHKAVIIAIAIIAFAACAIVALFAGG